MNTPKMNYVAVGGFVIAALVGIIIAVATLTGRTGATDKYFSIYSNVTGVKFGTQVFYEGYPVGQVEEVTPIVEGGAMKFKVNFEVTEGWQIPSDSIARIGAAGLLSAISINIDAGKSTTALKPGAQVSGREAADLFSVMSDMAGEVNSIAENDIRPLLATINRTADSFAATVETVGVLMEEDGERMVKKFAALADDLSERAPRIAKNIDEGTANFATLAKDLGETQAKLDKLLDATGSMVGENRSQVRQSIADLKHVADSLARHVDAVNQNLEGTARNMFEFSREIRKNPGLLLSGSKPSEKGPGQ